MSDIFVRVGGPDVDRGVSVHTMIRVFEDDVIGDNLWLWRADHAVLGPGETAEAGQKYHLVRPAEYRCSTCFESWGRRTVVYGLAAEHSLGDAVVWRGNFGRCFFFQCELPYGVNTQQFAHCVGYRVSAEKHEGWGMGVYCNFRDCTCLVKTAFAAPGRGVRLHNVFIKLLSGHDGILSVLNGEGGQVRSLAYK
mmetsp:Transcript_26776/g.60621  ORF Transcript_26776/g.60621 Transcript_26776/m.60621 type:complete len:194 (-) Transcript_26776:211-792(-)